MITNVTLNHTYRDFFGVQRLTHDTTEHGIDAKLIDRLIEKVVSDGDKGEMTAAFFGYHDGSTDCIWVEYCDRGTRTLTWRHDTSANDHDAPVKISTREFKKMVKERL